MTVRSRSDSARDAHTVPTDKGVSAEVELRIAALDERGGRSDIPVFQFVSTCLEGFSRRFRDLYHDRSAPPDPQRAVLAVSDTAGGSIYSARVEVQP